MRGYDVDRFRDKLTLLTAVEYRYPIHEYVGGTVFVEAGSVGADYGDLFDPDHYRFGGGGGLDVRTRDAQIFSVQVAYGEAVQFFITTDPIVAFEKKGGEQ